ncbi:MAG TPA: ABC transporter substrate-binding protein [Solirubrobacterales bacterium]|nr:ABC transporter substrate-binding protein [Solirubrobacterales bacterium]
MRVLSLAVWGVVLLLLGGCGSGDNESDRAALAGAKANASPRHTRALSVTLDRWHGPPHLGILMATARGYFADAGLEVVATSPATPARPIPYVVERVVDLSVAQLPQVVMAREKGAPIVAIGSLVSQSTSTMVWLKKSHLQDIPDLKGKTIGFPGVPFERAFLERVLAERGLASSEVHIKNVNYDLVPALVSGRVDAIFGGSANLEGVKLQAMGLEPVITPVEKLGVPAYDELVVVARRDSISQNPAAYRRFMLAVARGAAAAIELPEQAAEVVALSAEGEPFRGSGLAKAQVEATMPLLSKDGYMDPDEASQLVTWMKSEGIIGRTLPPAALLTNAFVKR